MFTDHRRRGRQIDERRLNGPSIQALSKRKLPLRRPADRSLPEQIGGSRIRIIDDNRVIIFLQQSQTHRRSSGESRGESQRRLRCFLQAIQRVFQSCSSRIRGGFLAVGEVDRGHYPGEPMLVLALRMLDARRIHGQHELFREDECLSRLSFASSKHDKTSR